MKTDLVFPALTVGAALAGLYCTFEVGYRLGNLVKGHSAQPEPKSIVTASSQASKPITTNIVDNGLGAWLAETNHHFGPWAAKSLYVMQLPDGKFYIRFKDVNGINAEFETFWEKDRAYDTAHDARRAFSVNMALQMKKAVSDAIEDAFK